MKQRVVIVGGGFGGVKAALELAEAPQFEVVLISNRTHFEYHGALYRTATGHSPTEVVLPLREIFKHHPNVGVVLDNLVDIDPQKRIAFLESGDSWAYHDIILAMGREKNFFGIAGLQEHAQSLYALSDTLALRAHLVRLFTSAKRRPKIAVIGAGPAGVELAAELQQFADRITDKHGHIPKEVDVTLIESADRVLPAFLPEASWRAEARLKKLGIDVRTNTRVLACEVGKVCLSSNDLAADITIWTAGNKSVGFYATKPEIFKLGHGGKVLVNNQLQAHGEHIYVIGDNAQTPYSGLAQTALHDAQFVAQNLKRLTRQQPAESYQPQQPLYVVPIGKQWAIVQDGQTVHSGLSGWALRRKGDLAIFRNFEPYRQAVQTWRRGNKLISF